MRTLAFLLALGFTFVPGLVLGVASGGEQSICPAPGLTSQSVQCQPNGTDGMTFAWSAVSGYDVTQYELQVCTDPQFIQNCRIEKTSAASRTITGLNPGTTYYARVRVSKAGLCSPPSEWSLWQCTTATGQARLSVSPSSARFTEERETVPVGQHKDVVFTVENKGSGGTIHGTVSSSDSAFRCIINQCSYTLGAGSAQNITIRFSPEKAGPANAIITFGNNAGNPVTANVTGDGSGTSDFRITRVTASPNTGSAPLNNVSVTAEYTGGSGSSTTLTLFCKGNTSDQTITTSNQNRYTFENACDYSSADNYTVRVDGTKGEGTVSQYATISVGGSSSTSSGGNSGGNGNIIRIENPLNADTLTDLISNILNFIFWVVTALVPLMVVAAGFLFVTGAGEQAKITRAKQILLWTVVGFSIILLSKGLTTIIRNIIGI